MVDHTKHFEAFTDYLTQAAIDLFESTGMTVEVRPVAEPETQKARSVMAVIGFGAPEVRGALLLLGSESAVASLEPEELRSGSPTEETLRDLFGEFCNLLLGRIKNQMLARKVAPMISTPMTVFGLDLKITKPQGGLSAWYQFATPQGDIYARLDSTFEDGFEMTEPEAVEACPVVEGEMLLF